MNIGLVGAGAMITAGAGAYLARHRIFPNLAGRDDSHNTIEGLFHSGISTDIRHALTEFGSGWDPLRKLAKNIYGGQKGSFGKMVKSKEFQEAISSGAVVKNLGFGAAGTADLMEATFRGERFQFVKKSGQIFSEEVPAMKAIEKSVGPSVYAHGEGFVAMEHFQGSFIGDIAQSKLKGMSGLEEEIASAFGKLHQQGYRHGDTLGNVMLVKHTDEIGRQVESVGLIDLGAAKKLSSFSPVEAIAQKAEDISVAQSAFRQAAGTAEEGLGFTPSFMKGAQPSATSKGAADDLFGFLDAPSPQKTIEGIHPEAPNTIGANVIKSHTDFGSGWSRIRSMWTVLRIRTSKKSIPEQMRMLEESIGETAPLWKTAWRQPQIDLVKAREGFKGMWSEMKKRQAIVEATEQAERRFWGKEGMGPLYLAEELQPPGPVTSAGKKAPLSTAEFKKKIEAMERGEFTRPPLKVATKPPTEIPPVVPQKKAGKGYDPTVEIDVLADTMIQQPSLPKTNPGRLLAKTSDKVCRVPFEMANNAGRRHSKSMAQTRS